MATLSQIRALIERDIRTNGQQAITGQVLQDRLLDIVDAIEYEAMRRQPLTFEAAENGVSLYWAIPETDSGNEKEISVSTDGGITWSQSLIPEVDGGILLATLNRGETVMVKGVDNVSPGYYTEDVGEPIGNYFRSDGGGVYAYGNIMSLYMDGFLMTAVPNYAFASLFVDYNGNYTIDLLSHPSYPLVLPATTLGESCYYNMFMGCTGLTVAPELPATTLAENCYDSMFAECTGLTAAPELPATTLAAGCYNNMFVHCSGLVYIKAMFTTTPSNTYTYGWVNGVAASGTFVKNAAATWDVTGNNGVPTGWTVETASE